LGITGIWSLVYVAITCIAFIWFRHKYKMLRPQVKAIVQEELVEYLKTGYEIWDVRSEREWEFHGIPGSRQIAHQQVVLLEPNLGVVCVCNSGIRAQDAAERLIKLGHAKVVYLKGSHLDCSEALKKMSSV
jgi:rhodanese-related sulfurtransferase